MKFQDMDFPTDKAYAFTVDEDDNVTEYEELEIRGPVKFLRWSPKPCTTCGQPGVGFYGVGGGEAVWYCEDERHDPAPDFLRVYRL